MIGDFDLGSRLRSFLWWIVKKRVGQRATDALMEQNETGGHLGALLGEAVTVASAVTLQQSVGLHLAQIIAELGEGICF